MDRIFSTISSPALRSTGWARLFMANLATDVSADTRAPSASHADRLAGEVRGRLFRQCGTSWRADLGYSESRLQGQYKIHK